MRGLVLLQIPDLVGNQLFVVLVILVELIEHASNLLLESLDHCLMSFLSFRELLGVDILHQHGYLLDVLICLK